MTHFNLQMFIFRQPSGDDVSIKPMWNKWGMLQFVWVKGSIIGSFSQQHCFFLYTEPRHCFGSLPEHPLPRQHKSQDPSCPPSDPGEEGMDQRGTGGSAQAHV